LKDYYKLLGVTKDSTQKEIKKAFRKKAKELHPDLNTPQSGTDKTFFSSAVAAESGCGASADEDMKLLLAAYKILNNEQQRREYDRIYSFYFKEEKSNFSYREFLKSQTEDLRCQAKLILYDLLHSHSEEATALYNSLIHSKPDFKLQHYLSWGDYMDCVFLLAEQFEIMGEYDKAYELYKLIYSNELKRPYFRHFTEEVFFRLRRLACNCLSRFLSTEGMVEQLRELIAFDFSARDNAILYKKLAELYLGSGKIKEALESLHKALANDKNVEGILNLQRKINIPETQMSI
jgi:curved DNA-binding protein CbpA